MGCFYLWGASAPRWQKMRCFLNAYERVLEAIETTQRPFVYRIDPNGRLNPMTVG